LASAHFIARPLRRRAPLRSRSCLSLPTYSTLAGQEGIEPPTPGFADRCAANSPTTLLRRSRPAPRAHLAPPLPRSARASARLRVRPPLRQDQSGLRPHP